MRLWVNLSLLLTVTLFACACVSNTPPAKPPLPASVSPGWTQQSYTDTAPPAGVTASCWLAKYAGPGSADVQICGYAAEAAAFDAQQRAPASGDAVKFQSGKYLVLIHWTGTSRAEITALVRAIQKSLAA
jgi:hypothetical protein